MGCEGTSYPGDALSNAGVQMRPRTAREHDSSTLVLQGGSYLQGYRSPPLVPVVAVCRQNLRSCTRWTSLIVYTWWQKLQIVCYYNASLRQTARVLF